MCAHCLANADDATLERLEKALLGLVCETRLRKDLDWDIDLDDLWLDPGDAEVVGAIWATYTSAIEQARVREQAGQEFTEADLRVLADAAQLQVEQGLALLSDDARTRLAPIIAYLNRNLTDMVSRNINPIQAGARMQEMLLLVGGAGGEGAPPQYSPYEWSRLCRTEAAFAQTAAQREYYQREFGAKADALERFGEPPIHPQCMCGLIAIEHEGETWMLIETTPTACGLCNDIADQMLDFVGL